MLSYKLFHKDIWKKDEVRRSLIKWVEENKITPISITELSTGSANSNVYTLTVWYNVIPE